MILNRRTDRPRPHQVYIGRPSKWGNPFRLRHEGERLRVIALYRTDLVHRLRTGRVTRAELAELDGRPLVCWCAPLACHGHVLRAAAAWAATQPDVGLEAASMDDGAHRAPRPAHDTTRSTSSMTPLDLITRRQYLEEENWPWPPRPTSTCSTAPPRRTPPTATPATPSSTACGPAGPTRSTA